MRRKARTRGVQIERKPPHRGALAHSAAAARHARFGSEAEGSEEEHGFEGTGCSEPVRTHTGYARSRDRPQRRHHPHPRHARSRLPPLRSLHCCTAAPSATSWYRSSIPYFK